MDYVITRDPKIEIQNPKSKLIIKNKEFKTQNFKFLIQKPKFNIQYQN